MQLMERDMLSLKFYCHVSLFTFRNVYETWMYIYALWLSIHECTLKVKCDHRSKFSNLSNWKEEAWKKSGLQRDSNPWTPRYRCDALPTELWSHTLGARSIYWVNFFPCSEIMWNIYEIIHICTAVYEMKVKCDHRSKFSNLSNWKEEAWKINHTAVQIWIISYIFHMISLHGKKWTQ